MGEHQIRIQPGAAGRSTIVIDEEDISAALAGYILSDDARRGPKLTLQVAWATKALVVGPARVEVDSVTFTLLRRLGWTPPKEDDE